MRIWRQKNATTIKDSFVLKEKEKEKLEKIINNHEKKNVNISSLSTQIPLINELSNNNNINNKKENQMTAIKMNKDIRKFLNYFLSWWENPSKIEKKLYCPGPGLVSIFWIRFAFLFPIKLLAGIDKYLLLKLIIPVSFINPGIS